MFSFDVTIAVLHLRSKYSTITTDTFYVWHMCLYVIILCDILQCNIINLIFVKDSNRFLFALARWQQLVPKISNFEARETLTFDL